MVILPFLQMTPARENSPAHHGAATPSPCRRREGFRIQTIGRQNFSLALFAFSDKTQLPKLSPT
jgi:hypothetical protein